MGYLKEYIDRGVQTACPPPPPTVQDLAAVLVPKASVDNGSGQHLQEINTKLQPVDPEIPLSQSCSADESAYNQSIIQSSPASPFATFISRRIPRRKLFLVERRPDAKVIDRRMVSMPDTKSTHQIASDAQNSTRVVSMPEYIAAPVDLSLDSIESPSQKASFESYVEKRHRVRVCPPPSDVPHTPSPPSSPESILIIDNDAQLPDGFLRRKYSPKEINVSGNGWTTWASSPPRPIPALHGPLSLPYARCPSGAEGTIIEEPCNVSRMVWGLGQDEFCQYRADSEHTDDETQHKVSHPQVPPRMQKKHVVQKPHQVRAAANNKKSKGDTGGGSSAAHRQHEHEHRTQGHLQGPHLMEPKVEQPTRGLPFSGSWRGEPSFPTVRDLESRERGYGSSFIDQELFLEVAYTQQSLQNAGLNQAYPEGLKPVFPVSNHPCGTPVYPKIFVEPRLNEVVHAAQRQSAMEIAKQYRQRQEFRLKQQAALPTPPSSSSPQWSSNFSPYQYPSVSPEIDIQGAIGLSHHIVRAQHPFVDASHQARRFLYDRQDTNVETQFFDGNGSYGPPHSRNDREIPPAATRHSSDSSGSLANYLRDLQTLSASTLAQQPRYSDTNSPQMPQHAAPVVRPVCAGHTSVSTAPPSPESPGLRSRSVSYQQPKSVPLARLMQRRLSSVPEEDLTGLVDGSSTYGYRFIDGHQGSLSSREYSGDNASSRRYQQEQNLNVPHGRVPSPDIIDEYEAQPYSFPHGTSPAKVRLPSVQEQEEYVYQTRLQSRSKGARVADSSQQLKKKPRGRKLRSDV